jgi:glycoside/pentoside/hexuronide:cation symporter, GPH family
MAVAATPQDSSTVPRVPSLTFWNKIAYGVGDVGAAVTAQVTGFFLIAFLYDVALLSPLAVGVIQLASNGWDAITDPFVGNLSDRTRTRWGRRRPWLLFGAIPFGLAFVAQWYVPPFEGTARVVYFLGVAILLKTGFTIVNVPYTSMTPELARGYDERTSLTSFRFAFSILGGLAAVVLYPAIVDLFTQEQVGNVVAGSLLGLVIVMTTLTTFFFTKEPPLELINDEKPLGFVASLRIAFSNRPFLYVVGIYLLAWLTVQFVQANLVLYVRYWLNLEDLLIQFLLVLQLTSFSFLFFWSWVSRRYGKRIAYYIGAGLFSLVVAWMFFLPPGNPSLVYGTCLVAGICVSMALLLPWSMLPDTVDWDELQTGRRREGVFYGLFVFIQKIGLALALGISSVVLGIGGYVNPATPGAFVAQPDSVLLTLRILVSFFPLALLVLSIPLVAAYPITRRRFDEMQDELAARKADAA